MKIFSLYPSYKKKRGTIKVERKFEILDNKNEKYDPSKKIFEDVYELKKVLNLSALTDAHAGVFFEKTIVVVSGGFDPIHVGHVRYIKSASKLKGHDGILVVIANKDSWLIRKKGYNFMKEQERMEIISSIEGVDYVLSWDDNSPNVVGCIEILEPHIFANGGDRDSIENVPEYDICKKIGCKMAFGVGGGKIQASSELISEVKKSK